MSSAGISGNRRVLFISYPPSVLHTLDLCALNLSGMRVYVSASVSYGDSTVLLGDLSCDGTEQNLLKCPHSVYLGATRPNTCELAAVRCERK